MGGSRAEEYKTRGNEAFKAQNWNKAIDCYTKAIMLDRKNNNYYSNRSAAYLHNGQPELALQDADVILGMSEQYIKGWQRKASALRAMKDYRGAIKVYEDALKVHPKEESFEKGLDACKRKLVEGSSALQAARVAQANNVAGASKQRKANSAKNVSQFVEHARAQLELKMAAIKAQLEVINGLVEMTDEEKFELLYSLIDKDGDGTLDAKELADSMRKRNADLSFMESLERAMDVVATYDVDGDAKLDRDEFQDFVRSMLKELGTSFHEFAEFLVIQILFASDEDEDEPEEETLMAQEEITAEVKARKALLQVINDPRMDSLYHLFDKDGDGVVDFKEVAIGLFQLTRNMEQSAKAAMNLLLMMDRKEDRVLDYEQFSRLMLGIVAAAESTFDEVADSLTLAMAQPTVVSEEDVKELMVADQMYEMAKDMAEQMKEEKEVLDALSYGKLNRLYDLWDENGDGTIDFKELLMGLRKFHGAMAMEESVERAALLMVGFDEDSNQQLDRSEFARAIVNYAQAIDKDVHELIDFMCVVSVLKENDEYERAYADSIAADVVEKVREQQHGLE